MRRTPTVPVDRKLKLLYFFEELLLFLSTFVLSTPSVANFAWKLLALTLATNFAVFLLRDYMRGRDRWVRLGKIVVALVLLGLVLIGIQDLRGKDWSGKIVEGWHWFTGLLASARTWIQHRL